MAQRGSSTLFHPSSGALVMSSIAGSMIPASPASSDSATMVAPSPPPTPSLSLVTIKDKPSDMGIKAITDKESWTDAKKIINARLRRAPYWPGESTALVTTALNIQSGSASAPGAFSASTEHESYDSGDEFDYEGKAGGAMYATGGKPNASSAYFTPSCCVASATAATVQASTGSVMGGPTHSMGGSMPRKVGFAPVLSPPTGDLSQSMGVPTVSRGSVLHSPSFGGPTLSHTSSDPKGVNTVYLPKTVLALLQNPPKHSLVHFQHATLRPCTSLLVADTGATDHMLPDKAAFISYYPVTGRRVRMGNNSFARIAGTGSAIISLNGKKILL